MNIYLCVIRLPAPYNTDVVITLNNGTTIITPTIRNNEFICILTDMFYCCLAVEVNPESSAATYVTIHPTADQTMTLWKTLLESFQITDYNLFES